MANRYERKGEALNDMCLRMGGAEKTCSLLYPTTDNCLAPVRGFEPLTYWLTASRSTIELHRNV